jgi:hypothetical protein
MYSVVPGIGAAIKSAPAISSSPRAKWSRVAVPSLRRAIERDRARALANSLKP